MAENRARPINRRQAIRTALAAVFGATVGASVGGIGGGVDSDAYVRKTPTATQLVLPGTNFVGPNILLREKFPGVAVGDIPLVVETTLNEGIRLRDLANPDPSIAGIAQTLNWSGNQFLIKDDSQSTVQLFAAGFLPANEFINILALDNFQKKLLWGDGAIPTRLLSMDFTLPPGSGGSGFTFSGDGFNVSVPANPGITPIGAPLQVGLPTSLSGAPSAAFAAGGHRHAFSGRFPDSSNTIPVALGPAGPFPYNIGLRLNLNNWTLRRVNVFTLTPPTGGTETYGIVNGAGALQGTAVVLAAGAFFQVGALQVTNLLSNTNYFFAQTASGAVTPSADTKVYAEYTMNV